MKLSKKEVRCPTSSIPELRFEEQALTSFSGLVMFQKLFHRLGLLNQLRGCVRHLRAATSYHPAAVLQLLVVHLVLGWRRLRDLDYYQDDPMVNRVLGLRRIPSVSTVSRGLRAMDAGVVKKLRKLVRQLVIARILTSKIRRVTLDFDGSVLSSTR